MSGFLLLLAGWLGFGVLGVVTGLWMQQRDTKSVTYADALEGAFMTIAGPVCIIITIAYFINRKTPKDFWQREVFKRNKS